MEPDVDKIGAWFGETFHLEEHVSPRTTDPSAWASNSYIIVAFRDYAREILHIKGLPTGIVIKVHQAVALYMPMAKSYAAKVVATRDRLDKDRTNQDVLDYGSLVFATPTLTDEDRANVSAVVFSVDTWKMDKNFTATNYEEEPLDID